MPSIIKTLVVARALINNSHSSNSRRGENESKDIELNKLTVLLATHPFRAP